MEVSQFTYFQQVGGHDCKPVSGELTYGLERLAIYILGVDHVMDMPFNDPQSPIPLLYGDVFKQTEQEYSRWNFDVADTDTLLQHFKDAEAECQRILEAPADDPKTGRRIIMAHPAYDQCIKASHVFNLLDARGVISVTERQAYIGRVRTLANYYDRVDGLTEVSAYGDAFPVSDYQGIDAETSPLKLRACFTVDWDYYPSDEYKLAAEPLVAPDWFSCFDAEQITLDILNDKAIAILAAENEIYGFSRYIAQYEDGRAFMWRQINECGEASFAGDDLPEGCPPAPES